MRQLFAHAAPARRDGTRWFSLACDFRKAAHTKIPLADETDQTLRNGMAQRQRYHGYVAAQVIVDRKRKPLGQRPMESADGFRMQSGEQSL